MAMQEGGVGEEASVWASGDASNAARYNFRVVFYLRLHDILKMH